jgi:hypothetical protein
MKAVLAATMFMVGWPLAVWPPGGGGGGCDADQHPSSCCTPGYLKVLSYRTGDRLLDGAPVCPDPAICADPCANGAAPPPYEWVNPTCNSINEEENYDQVCWYEGETVTFPLFTDDGCSMRQVGPNQPAQCVCSVTIIEPDPDFNEGLNFPTRVVCQCGGTESCP